jgi:formylglycine-generating enzyme required for sulfatase activity/tRNA A-37 threonylcarbamoyl transferase component Bud32
MPKPNDRIGPYLLIRKLGEGGFGEVWLARDSGSSESREVAVKMPLKSEIEFDALLQEATLWARASAGNHPNVLAFVAARVFGGQVVLVSEFAPDGSLKDWLKQHGDRAPSVEAAVQMTYGILAGLEHLHSQNIIHRDVKPDNVLLSGVTPRLADFGVSRVLKTTSHTVQGAGTPAYMAPEAFKRKRNQQTDLWSVGVMLYQMLSGRLPFDGSDITELYGAILNEDPEPLPAEIPEWLQQVVENALSKDTARRFKSAKEMRAALLQSKSQPVRETRKVDEPIEGRLSKVETPAIEYGKVMADHSPKSEMPSEPKTNLLLKQKSSTVGRFGLRPALKYSGIGLAAIALATVIIYFGLRLRSSGELPPNPGDEFSENLNGVSLVLKHVPGGEFLMGSPDNEEGRDNFEGPQHRVTVQDFYIGKTEVTQAQWKAVMGTANPSRVKGDDLPVDSISWSDAMVFCAKLSQMTGKIYRLPSEAEWEYACRAGTTGAYAGNLDAMAWYSGNAGGKTHPVGQKQPNRFGLYDMQGNVWEWCEDVWHDNYLGAPSDGSAWLAGGDSSLRVLRGGAWNLISQYIRSANRTRRTPNDRSIYSGVRVVSPLIILRR